MLFQIYREVEPCDSSGRHDFDLNDIGPHGNYIHLHDYVRFLRFRSPASRGQISELNSALRLLPPQGMSWRLYS